jgi:hypothetical protein
MLQIVDELRGTFVALRSLARAQNHSHAQEQPFIQANAHLPSTVWRSGDSFRGDYVIPKFRRHIRNSAANAAIVTRSPSILA